jgi:hypothetical protein
VVAGSDVHPSPSPPWRTASSDSKATRNKMLASIQCVACRVDPSTVGTGSEQRVLRPFALGQERERLTRDVCLKMQAFLVSLEGCFIPKQFVE